MGRFKQVRGGGGLGEHYFAKEQYCEVPVVEWSMVCLRGEKGPNMVVWGQGLWIIT